MEMKWNPIKDGDLSGIPRNEEFLFTIFDEINHETYVNIAWIVKCEGKLQVRETTIVGVHIVEAKNVQAWMEIPEPYVPGRCDTCKHWKEWIDEFGDGCAMCELIVDPPFLFSTEQYFKCPLNR